MLKTLVLFIIAIVGMFASHLLAGHQGQVFIQTHTKNIQMSLTVLFSLIIIVYLIATFILHLSMRLLRSPSHTINWFKQRRTKRAQQSFETIIQQLIMKHHLSARELLKTYQLHTPHAALPLLLAAANELDLKQYATADQHLTQAKKLANKTEQPLFSYLAIRSALEQQNYSSVEPLLSPWLQSNSTSDVFLDLALRYYNVTGQYDLALEILPKLHKQLQWHNDYYQKLQQEIYSNWMQTILNNQGIEPLLNWWAKQKKEIIQQPKLQVLLTTLCYQAGEPELSEKFIIKYNQKNTHIELLGQLIKQPLVTPEKIVVLLQKKQLNNPNDLHLKRVLAYTFSANQQHQEAITLLLECVARYPNAEDYWQLSKLYHLLQAKTEELASRELTLQCYREGKIDFPPFTETSWMEQRKKSLLDTLYDDTQK